VIDLAVKLFWFFALTAGWIALAVSAIVAAAYAGALVFRIVDLLEAVARRRREVRR